ncbi:STAS domain-containing protein [Nonomuraea angiospora]|uniref:STAS domain-containing protein n=1 Tax=Nonomuraea angiospora TaxID=46172 RepID=UPI0034435B77
MAVIDTAPLGGAMASAPTLVHLPGDIGIFTTAGLRQRLLNTLDYSTDLLVLDLSQVTFCGAGGLGVMIGVQSRARARGNVSARGRRRRSGPTATPSSSPP